MLGLFAHGFIYDFDIMYNSFILAMEGTNWYILGGVLTSGYFTAQSILNKKTNNNDENYIFGILLIGVIWPFVLIVAAFMVLIPLFKKDKNKKDDKVVQKTE